MLVASAGGHLDELMILVDTLGAPIDDAVWVTSRSAHTESLMRDREVIWLPRVGSGEKSKAIRAMPAALQLHRRIRPELVVSTGALFAVPHLIAARLHRCETWFIDSATRVQGPSATGRLAQRLPGTRLFMQRPGWSDPRWTDVPSVFDAFESTDESASRVHGVQKVVVSLGSERWPFGRAVRGVLELLPGTDIVWQTGVTEHYVAGERLRQWVPADELRREIAEADVVITHAGVGSVLSCLESGKVPVVLPRSAGRQEHVDDHQREFADLVDQRGLAVSVDPDALSMADLVRAASLRAVRR